ncbi:hypothetical protein LOK49_LG04G01132 [Camellia lanceoleosa]|uniref:Uncharacterized protein n=1 Tax=Camellia lanceoleosa TaxID=1840588 RepID=A0ACC0HXB6_9ERIC|nr:hypothetical protein LOK49_LG04G01132 [Camellia lanceoleosa]
MRLMLFSASVTAHTSEAQQSALNSLLFCTGDQSRDVVLCLPQTDRVILTVLSLIALMNVQASVYGRPDCVLDSQLFKEVVDYKVAEHRQQIKLASENGQPA